ncbi:MerR family transcriptional regulator [Vibrio cholerae]|nr:MerR family transcriptional regulator [Vibrio cholerae]
MKIGELAARAGASTRALRYYEEQGLLMPDRTAAGHRIYTEAALSRVQLIQELFTAGLSSRLLVRLLPAIDAKHLKPALVAHLETEHARLTSDISKLQAAHRRLGVLIELSTHPDNRSCPTSLDQTTDGRDAKSRSTASPASTAAFRRNHAA